MGKSRKRAVDPDLRFEIGGTEVQDHAVALEIVFREGERFSVPYGEHEVLEVDARQGGFGAEGNGDGGFEVLLVPKLAVFAAVTAVDLKFPSAVEVRPSGTLPLGIRMLGAGDRM